MSASSAKNRQVRLAARPHGEPAPADWSVSTEPVPEPGEGELVVRVSHISIDPTIRGWMNDGKGYMAPVNIGDVMRALGAGTVIASRHSVFSPGQHVTGMFGVQEYALSDGDGVVGVDIDEAPLSTHLHALGMTGMTAYFGLFDIGRAEPGDTVLVSGAAGAVGSMVGQLAQIHKCRVVGIAGGPAKCSWLTDELGFDAAVDYRDGEFSRTLRAATPEGVDVYFDNVGGEVLDAGLARLRRGARVVLSGAISQYNNPDGRPAGPRNYLNLIFQRARMEGFVVLDHADRYGEAVRRIAEWLRSGELQSQEDVVVGGVDDFPATLMRLFRGENMGKVVLELT